jgi:exopolysaccharide biosynthesis polyprenyl glycosylphosphotransferase
VHKSVISRWGPRLCSKLNIGFDLAALIAAALFCGGPLRFNSIFCALTAALLWAVASFVVRYYDPWASRSGVEETAMVSLLVLGVATAMWLLQLAMPWLAGALRVEWFFLLLWPAVLGPRMFVFRKLDLKEMPAEQVLIVGAGATGRCTAEELEDRPRARLQVIGHLRFPDEAEVTLVRDAPVLGTCADLEEILRARPVHEVYIAGYATRHAESMQKAIRTCEKFGVPFALPAYSFRLERAQPALPSAVSDGYLHYLPHAPRPYQRSLKRLFDIFAATVALVLLSPLLLAVAAIIKLTSKGPIFFRQQRVGLHGRPFHMFKFRSMVANAEELKEKLRALNEQSGPVFKMKNDPRVTPIGRFIRKYSIDELPQLINVLRGDMSIVGPRPPVPKEVAQYEGWQRRRLSVRPGLTCIWQVSGRNQISFKEWMYLDMRYIDHWSLSEDMSLILQTFPVVLTGRGAS